MVCFLCHSLRGAEPQVVGVFGDAVDVLEAGQGEIQPHRGGSCSGMELRGGVCVCEIRSPRPTATPLAATGGASPLGLVSVCVLNVSSQEPGSSVASAVGSVGCGDGCR